MSLPESLRPPYLRDKPPEEHRTGGEADEQAVGDGLPDYHYLCTLE